MAPNFWHDILDVCKFCHGTGTVSGRHSDSRCDHCGGSGQVVVHTAGWKTVLFSIICVAVVVFLVNLWISSSHPGFF
jgi:DnaJ-class molecular chaperone